MARVAPGGAGGEGLAFGAAGEGGEVGLEDGAEFQQQGGGDGALDNAQAFAEAIQRQFPGKMLAYNCSPSFNWKRKMGAAQAEAFQREIGTMGYKFQFITLAGFRSMLGWASPTNATICRRWRMHRR